MPTFSQEIHAGEFPEYDGGGEAWCSPTSTAMVVAFHGAGPTPDDLEAFPGSRYDDPQVVYAARYTYDWNYKGAGNWPANVAYATRFGLDGFVTRLRSLNEAQRFLDVSIPLVASINGELPGFLLGRTNGHLLVIRGFQPNGDVITNDPAVKTDQAGFIQLITLAGVAQRAHRKFSAGCRDLRWWLVLRTLHRAKGAKDADRSSDRTAQRPRTGDRALVLARHTNREEPR